MYGASPSWIHSPRPSRIRRVAASRQLLDEGADALKIYAPTYWDLSLQLSPRVLTAIVAEAHRRRVQVFAHPVIEVAMGAWTLCCGIDSELDDLRTSRSISSVFTGGAPSTRSARRSSMRRRHRHSHRSPLAEPTPARPSRPDPDPWRPHRCSFPLARTRSMTSVLYAAENDRRFRFSMTHSYRTFVRNGVSIKPGQVQAFVRLARRCRRGTVKKGDGAFGRQARQSG